MVGCPIRVLSVLLSPSSPDQLGCTAGPKATKATTKITRYTPQSKSKRSRDVGAKPWHDTPQATKLMHISCSYQWLPNSTKGNDSTLRIACSTKLHFTFYGTRLQPTPGKHQDNCWDAGLAHTQDRHPKHDWVDSHRNTHV